ncbi:MAG TPA: SRPBCC family protein [Propionibacteriaceae bacterium]|nr:SRPBCC family protein [Propionibacteriaceae bacterium]
MGTVRRLSESGEPLEWPPATRAIGDQTSGVGARRRVELKPIGSMEETVTFWEEGRRIDTQNLPSASVPFSHAESTLTLEPDAEGTLATFDYRYVPRGGPLGRLAGPLIDKMLMGTFTDMLAATDEPPARMVVSAEPPSFGALASAAHGAVLLVTGCVGRAGCSIAEGLVRSDCVVDDAESVDLHVHGVAVGDHAAE